MIHLLSRPRGWSKPSIEQWRRLGGGTLVMRASSADDVFRYVARASIAPALHWSINSMYAIRSDVVQNQGTREETGCLFNQRIYPQNLPTVTAAPSGPFGRARIHVSDGKWESIVPEPSSNHGHTLGLAKTYIQHGMPSLSGERSKHTLDTTYDKIAADRCRPVPPVPPSRVTWAKDACTYPWKCGRCSSCCPD